MTRISLEQRVAELERVVEELRRSRVSEPGRDDWKNTVGAFKGDAIAAEIIHESLRLREVERKRAKR